MANPPPPRKKSWRDTAAAPPKTRGVNEAWRKTDGAGPAGPSWWSRRWARLAFVSGGLALVTGAVVLWILLIHPPRPIRLVLLGAGYETNLAVPHNVPGMNGLDALADWATEYSKDGRGDPPQRAKLKSDLQEVLQALEPPSVFGRKAPKTLAVVLSAHGVAIPGADGELTPYLVADDATLADPATSFIPLDKVLEPLAQFKDSKILLVLDCTAAGACWPLGALHNDFVRAVKARQQHLRQKVNNRNLVVLCSSDDDQRSWADMEWGQTAFTHYLLEGLRGEADKRPYGEGHERIQVRHLCGYVRDKVQHWARYNRFRHQTPVVLGEGPNFELVVKYPGKEPAPAAPDADTKRLQDDLKKGWESPLPHAAVYTPQQWRRYLETLLRAEDLLRWGDAKSSARLLAGLQAPQPPALVRHTAPLTLTMPAALGLGLSAAEVAELAAFETKWQQGKRLKDCQDLLDALLVKVSKDRLGLVGSQAAGSVLRQVAAAPGERWDDGVSLVHHLDRLLDYRPAEVHYLTMLQPDPDPRDATKAPVAALRGGKDGVALLGRALQVRLLAEQAAVGRGPDESAELPAYSEEVRPWIEKTIEEADRERRFGEDLLFTSDAQQWKKADQTHLATAAQKYQQAQATARAVRTALLQRDRALAMLPSYTRWVGERGSREDVGAVVHLWAKVHQLLKDLSKPTPAADPLGKLAAQVEAGLGNLVEKVKVSARKGIADRQEQDGWHEIEATLAVPFLDGATREKLSHDLAAVSRVLHDAADKAPSGAPDNLGDTSAAARQAARQQGQLALAVLGPREADDGRALDGAADEIKRLEEKDWYFKVDLAGQAIGQVFNGLARAAEKRAAEAAAANVDLATAREKLQAAALDTRQAAAAAAEQGLQPGAVAARRRLLLHDLLCWQAKRTYLDFWADKQQQANQTPYFRRAGRLFLDDARELALSGVAATRPGEKQPRLAEEAGLRDKIDKAGPVWLKWSRDGKPESFQPGPERFNLTDEPKVERYYRLGGRPADVEGYPVVWAQVSTEDQPDREAAGSRRAEEFDRSFKEKLFAEGGTRAGAAPTHHVVNGYFRGHHPVVVTDLIPYPRPDLEWSEPSIPPYGHVAVQTRQSVYETLGARDAAVALVLDFSKSMLDPAKGEREPKYIQAQKVLHSVLKDFPAGVRVSLHVFGIDHPRSDALKICPLWESEAWNPDPAQLKKKMDELAALKPAWGTPLLEAIWLAREDLLKQNARTRSMVVITDGGDTVFYNPIWDRVKARTGVKDMKELLEKGFGDGTIQLSVIGYDVESASPDEQKTAKEFIQALKAVGAAYHPANDTGRLKESLERTLLHRYFQIDPDGGAERASRDNQISRSDRHENLHWVQDLPPEKYRVRLPSIRLPGGGALEKRLRLDRGDALLLDLVGGERRAPTFRRALYAESGVLKQNKFFVLQAENRPEGWLLAVLQNQQQRNDDRLHLLATLEKEPDAGDDPRTAIQQLRPRWAWFEVPAPPKGPKLKPLRVQFRPNYPAPAWAIEVQDWPTQAAATLNAWWLAALPRPAAEWVRREDWTESPEELTAKDRRHAKAGPPDVVLESVTLEQCEVRRKPGPRRAGEPEKEKQDCLVVRLKFPADGEPFFVRLPEWDQDRSLGQEHRFYGGAGKYTGVFWPVNADSVKRLLKLELYSVKDLKKDSLKTPKFALGEPNDKDAPEPAPSEYQGN
jgi:hypothetical protein